MGKIKQFLKDHTKELVIAGGGIALGILGAVSHYKLNGAVYLANHPIDEPSIGTRFESCDQAIDIFKDLLDEDIRTASAQGKDEAGLFSLSHYKDDTWGVGIVDAERV